MSDYRLLYQAFEEMPAFSDGVGTATLDYIQGLSAPSTYIGLALPGIGKGAGIAATQAAKEGVKFTLKNAFTKPISLLASQAAARPITTTLGVEAAAGSLQNIAAQKTEIEADLRDDFSVAEAATVAAISGVAAPAALIPGAIKGAIARKAEAGTGDLVGEAAEAVQKANDEALERTKKVLKDNTELADSIKAALPEIDATDVLKKKPKKKPLDPDQVKSGAEIVQEEAEKLGMADWQRIAPTKEQVSRIFGAVTEIMVNKLQPKPGERITEAVARVIREANLGDEVAPEIMKKYNITSDDLANLVMADASAAAAELGVRIGKAKVFKNLNEVAANDIFALSKERKKVLDKLSKQIDEGDARGVLETSKEIKGETKTGIVRTLDQVRLASMTSQTATTIRNTASGVSRVGIDLVMKSFDRGVASAAKKIGGGKGTVSLGSAVPNKDITAVVFGIMNKKESTAITDIFDMGFHTKATQLFKQLRI